MTEQQQTIREAVGVFDNRKMLYSAIAELENTAFPRHDISILGGDREMEKQYGTTAIDPLLAEDNPDAPRIAPIRPEEKALGASILIGGTAYFAGCGAAIISASTSKWGVLAAITVGSLFGAAVGAVAALIIGIWMNKRIKNQIRKGGVVLWVRTPGPNREKLARDILRKHGGKDVHIHETS